VSSTATRPVAGLWLKCVAAVAGLLVAGVLGWVMRGLIVPAVLSGLLAYICRPLVATLERYRVRRGVAIGLLLLAFVLATLFGVARIRMIVPTEIEALEYRVHAQYAINEQYRKLMGLDATLARGNRAYQFLQADLDPLVDRANQMLALTTQERALFLATRSGGAEAAGGADRLLDEDRANLQTLAHRARMARATPVVADAPALPAATRAAPTTTRPLSWLAQLLSTWIIAPFVFFFLLSDTGEIKRGLLSMVPNRLFEPALTVLADLDHALGDWLRGLFLECCLLGISVVVLLAVIGIPLRWAIAIGIFTGATNVVPYLGTAVALAGGLAYALLAGQIHPLIPLVTADNLVIWVVLAVGTAELLKNMYEPVVLGSAAKLHPLVIVIGATGGAILFGLVGVLLAIPTISMLKVFVSSTARQLKAYGLI
jgi:predicted PurR-regulated permease PerM